MSKNVELSVLNVRRFFERNRIAYTLGKGVLLFNRQFSNNKSKCTYNYIAFVDGCDLVGRQHITFGRVTIDALNNKSVKRERASHCTDMAFFAFHFHDLYRDLYPRNEYRSER